MVPGAGRGKVTTIIAFARPPARPSRALLERPVRTGRAATSPVPQGPWVLARVGPRVVTGGLLPSRPLGARAEAPSTGVSAPTVRVPPPRRATASRVLGHGRGRKAARRGRAPIALARVAVGEAIIAPAWLVAGATVPRPAIRAGRGEGVPGRVMAVGRIVGEVPTIAPIPAGPGTLQVPTLTP